MPAYFTHSHYPLIRGLLKGWMPQFRSIIKNNSKIGDIIYTAIEPNLLTTYFNSCLAKKLGLKHVFFTWQNIPYKHRLNGLKLKFTEWLVRRVINNSQGAICGNHKAAEILKAYASSSFKILVAPISGVDIDKFKPNVESDFRIKNDLGGKIVLTFAGVFDDRKGIKTLLNSFLEAIKDIKDLSLVLIGTGPLRDYINNFIKENNLDGSIVIIPWLPNDELPSVYAGSDIFIYPSEPHGGWEEQFGFSMAEASSSRLPIIATKTGSIEEVVINNSSGILVVPGDVEGLREVIIKLARNRSLRTQFGISGRKYIEENFSHEVISRKFFNFLKGL